MKDYSEGFDTENIGSDIVIDDFEHADYCRMIAECVDALASQHVQRTVVKFGEFDLVVENGRVVEVQEYPIDSLREHRP